jgi:hypothetical protein
MRLLVGKAMELTVIQGFMSSNHVLTASNLPSFHRGFDPGHPLQKPIAVLLRTTSSSTAKMTAELDVVRVYD